MEKAWPLAVSVQPHGESSAPAKQGVAHVPSSPAFIAPEGPPTPHEPPWWMKPLEAAGRCGDDGWMVEEGLIAEEDLNMFEVQYSAYFLHS